MADNNNISNTMEIDSILAEARQRKTGSRPLGADERTRVVSELSAATARPASRPAPKTDSRPSAKAASRSASKADSRTRVVAPKVEPDDGYVLIDENGSYNDPSRPSRSSY